MAHSLVTPPPPTSPSPISAIAQKKLTQWCCIHQGHIESQFGKATANIHHRRAFIYGLIGAGIGSSVAPDVAVAAKRRPPPPPPAEKKDPNVSGVQAKVIASMKRKEAMKEEIAKLREKGKPTN